MRSTLLAVIVAACGTDDIQNIPVESQNDLGIVAIQTDSAHENGERTFELRGLDGAGEVIAAVRVHSGAIREILDHLPGLSDEGTKIEISDRGEVHQLFTREVARVSIIPPSPAVEQFLTLREVEEVLAPEDLHVFTTSRAGEVAYTSHANCPQDALLTSPVARQCCYQEGDDWGGTQVMTVFLRGSDGQAVQRLRGSPCTGPNGESCSGAGCYFGPNGFSRPSVWNDSYHGWPYGNVWVDWYTNNCTVQWSYAPIESYWIEFTDVTGTFPTGQGCPGGATGAFSWDY